MRSRLSLAVGSALVRVSTRLAQTPRVPIVRRRSACPATTSESAAARVFPVNPQGQPAATGAAARRSTSAGRTGTTGANGRRTSWDSRSISVYSMLPLDESQFLVGLHADLGPEGLPRPAASSAGVFELATNFRFRIPSPFIMPTINFGLGFIELGARARSTTPAPLGTGSAKQQTSIGRRVRRSVEDSSKHIVDRYGRFRLKQTYAYGYTSFGQGAATPRRPVCHEQLRRAQEHEHWQRCAAV